MTTSAPITPTHLRPLNVGGAGHMRSHMAKPLLRRGCDIVMFGSQSTTYRDVVPDSEPLPLVAKKSVGGQALQGKPARFDLKNIVDDDRKWEKKVASQSGNA